MLQIGSAARGSAFVSSTPGQRLKVTMPASASQPARLAFLVRDLGLGGVGRSTLRLAQHFLDRGIAVDIVLEKDKGPLRTLVPEGVGVTVLETSKQHWRTKLMILRADPGGLPYFYHTAFHPKRPMGSYPRLPSLVRYLREARPDALISALTYQNLLAIAAARAAGTGTKVLVSERTTVNDLTKHSVSKKKERVLPLLVRRQYLMADAIIAVSDGVANHLARQVNLPRERIATVYNPVVGPDLFASAAAPVDHPWFQPGQPPVVLGVGRLQEQKDYPTLIRAFARLRALRPARLVILGQGPKPGRTEAAQAELRELASSLGVVDDLDVPGYADNPYAYMAQADLFVLSSAWEGFGNALAEALACGCPVVATDCPSGPAEILDGGRYGPLAPVGDDAALAKAMAHVLDAPPDRDFLRRRGSIFTVERAADAYLQALFGNAAWGTTSSGKSSLKIQ
jgi:glycosyltransferase involved in cell wall biosynthesis